LAQRRKRQRKLPILYILFWIFLIAMFGGLGVMQMSRYYTYLDDLNRLEDEIIAEQARHTNMLAEMEWFESDAYIEKLARDLLGYVKSDEIVFINVAD